jgi:hypothetical protein
MFERVAERSPRSRPNEDGRRGRSTPSCHQRGTGLTLLTLGCRCILSRISAHVPMITAPIRRLSTFERQKVWVITVPSWSPPRVG